MFFLFSPQDVQTFSIKDIVALNLDMDQTSFLILVWADVKDVGTICSKLGECIHVEVVYTNSLPGKITGGEFLLFCQLYKSICLSLVKDKSRIHEIYL